VVRLMGSHFGGSVGAVEDEGGRGGFGCCGGRGSSLLASVAGRSNPVLPCFDGSELE